MNLNSIIFPAPSDDKLKEMDSYKEELIFIPKTLSDGKEFHIPCLLQKSRKGESGKYFFYFHGNAEDIFTSTANLDIVRSSLPVLSF